MKAQNAASRAESDGHPVERTLAILAYHKIGNPSVVGWETWYYISESLFVGHLQWLRDNGWLAIDLVTFRRSLDDPPSLPERAVLLTFDDGYRSMREVALPILRRFDIPAVLFMPTDYIGKMNTFDSGDEPDEALCDWDDLRALEGGNVAIQSHGCTHRTFSELSLVDQAEELRLSKSLLETHLDRTVDVFAYPYGDPGEDPVGLQQAMRDAGYRAAFLYKGGLVRMPITDRYHVTRIAMGPDTDLRDATGCDHVESGPR